MPALPFKILRPIDIESICDELAGYPIAIRVTPQGMLEVEIDETLNPHTLVQIISILDRLGADVAAAVAGER